MRIVTTGVVRDGMTSRSGNIRRVLKSAGMVCRPLSRSLQMWHADRGQGDCLLPLRHGDRRAERASTAGRRPLARGPAALALLVLIVAALIMGQVPTAAVPREVGYVLAGLAVAALGWRYFGRRR